MIPGTCPDCGAIRPLTDYVREGELREALAAALAVPAPLARAVIGYLRLHAPAGRAVQARKLIRLLHELAELLGSGQVSRRGISHPCPPAVWQAAMDSVEDRRADGTLRLPLDNHAYLTEIAFRIASAEAREREQAAAARRRGDTPLGYSAAHLPSDQPADPAVAARAAMQAIVGELSALKRLAQGSPLGTFDARIQALQAMISEEVKK